MELGHRLGDAGRSSDDGAARRQGLEEEVPRVGVLFHDEHVHPVQARIHHELADARRERRGVLVDVVRGDGDSRTFAQAKHLVWAVDRLLAQAVQAVPTPGAVQVRVGADELHATLRIRASGVPTLGANRLALAVARAAIQQQGGALRVPELAEEGVLAELRLPLASG